MSQTAVIVSQRYRSRGCESSVSELEGGISANVTLYYCGKPASPARKELKLTTKIHGKLYLMKEVKRSSSLDFLRLIRSFVSSYNVSLCPPSVA
jgi:hypothetical protein